MVSQVPGKSHSSTLLRITLQNIRGASRLLLCSLGGQLMQWTTPLLGGGASVPLGPACPLGSGGQKVEGPAGQSVECSRR